MKKLEDLIKNIYADGDVNLLEETFQKLAKKFFYGGYFAIGEKRVFLMDIEFYYHEENMAPHHIHDNIMYHRNSRDAKEPFPQYFIQGSFHEHSSGLDFCFENEENEYRASILIRKVRVIDGNGKSFVEDRPQFISGLFLMNNSVFGNGIVIRWVDIEELTSILLYPMKRKNVPDSTDNDDVVIKKNVSSLEDDFSKVHKLEKKWRFQKPILTDTNTNKVYFSDWLRKDYANETQKITAILDRYHVSYDFLEYTKDIWARDYMPIQLDQHIYVKFRYEPDYLLKEGLFQYATDCYNACKRIKIQYLDSDIIIDGGNIIKTPRNVLIVDKVYQENNCTTTEEKRILRERLEKLLGYKPILLPWDKEEKLGHADGLVRYIGNNTLLLANYNEWQGGNTYFRRIKSILEHAGYNVVSLHFTEGEYAATDSKWSNEDTWMYINYLQTNNVIIVPSTGNLSYDISAKLQFEKLFPDYIGRIEFVDVRKITNNPLNGGGAMNCISWNIIC